MPNFILLMLELAQYSTETNLLQHKLHKRLLDKKEKKFKT